MHGIRRCFAPKIRLWTLLIIALLALMPVAVVWALGDELDDTFAGDGGARITPQSGEQAQEVVGLIARDDVIIAALNLTNTNTTFTAGGLIALLDDSGQKINTDPSTENKTSDTTVRYRAMIELPNDEILVVGTVNASNPAEKRDFLIKRFKVDLQADPVIQELTVEGSSGIGISTGTDDIAYAAYEDVDGKVIVAGSFIQTNNLEYITAIRLSPPNYTLDTTFGNNGRLIENSKTGRIYSVSGDVPAIGPPPQGPRYLFAGRQPSLNADGEAPLLMRITDDGERDNSYNPAFDDNLYGSLRTVQSFPCGGPDICALVAGEYRNGPTGDSNLAFELFDSDATQNGGQFAETRVQRGGTPETLVAFERLSNGKFLLAGNTVSDIGTNDFIVARLNQNRQPDDTFGLGGVVVLDVGPITDGLSASRDKMLAATLQSDGKLLSGGFAINTGSILGGRPLGVVTRHTIGGDSDAFTVNKLSNKTRVKVGDELTYLLQMTGPANTTFLLTDTLPSILTNYSYTVTTGVVVTEVGSSDYAWEVTLPANGGRIHITGEVTSTSNTDENVLNIAEYGLPGSPPATAQRLVYLDVTPPNTTLEDTPPDPDTSALATFTWSATDQSGTISGYECSLDSGAFAECATPYETPALASGPHTFAVRAIDEAGLADPTPATHNWTIDLFEIDTSQNVSATLSGGDDYTLTVTIPAGAIDLPGDVALSFAPVDPTDLPPAVTGEIVLGFDLTFLEDAVVRSPYTFTTPITVEIAYDPDLVSNPDQLQLYFKQGDGSYSSDGITIVEPRGNPLTVVITHLSEFALIEDALPNFLPAMHTR